MAVEDAVRLAEAAALAAGREYVHAKLASRAEDGFGGACVIDRGLQGAPQYVSTGYSPHG